MTEPHQPIPDGGESKSDSDERKPADVPKSELGLVLDETKPSPEQPSSGEKVPAFTFSPNIDARSVHLHDSVSLPPYHEAKELQQLYPGFMQEMMEARSIEQRHRHSREKRQQAGEFEIIRRRENQRHDRLMAFYESELSRFNLAMFAIVLLTLTMGGCAIYQLFLTHYLNCMILGSCTGGLIYQVRLMVRDLKTPPPN